MLRLVCLIMFALVAQSASALYIDSPQPNATGDYTVYFSPPVGCYGDEFSIECYTLRESTDGLNWYSVAPLDTSSWSATGKSPGIYYYAVFVSSPGYPEGVFYDGPEWIQVGNAELAISDASIGEGGTLAFTVTRSQIVTTAITVNYATGNGNAEANDYTPVSGSLEFGYGEVTKTIYVNTTQDTVFEGNLTMPGYYEYIDVTLTGTSAGIIVDGYATGTIQDDDSPPTFAISDATATEGGVLQFTVTKTGATEFTETGNYASANGTATAPNDYTAASGSVSFVPSDYSELINITSAQDGTVEGNETVILNLTGGFFGSVTDGQGIGTIVDDETGIPSGLTGPLGTPSTSVTLSWTASLGTVVYYELERIFDGATALLNTGSTATSYAAALSSDGTYRFRVRGCNSVTCSGWSNPHQVIRSSYDAATGVPALGGGSGDAGPSVGLTDFNGIVAGQANVAPSGAATYTIPIAIPPGTRGMQPSVALVYSSHGGEGLVGQGWSIAGAASAITRCYPPAVTYTWSDRFCLDGQRLIVASAGGYGNDGVKYRTELDTFREVVSNGGTSSSPDSFTVRTGDGRTLTYGGTALSNLQATAPNALEVERWMLRRVEDKFGNFYELTYFEDEPNGHNHLTRIDYSGHTASPATAPYARVELEYEALPATNVVVRYRAGSAMSIQQRLKSVKTFDGASQVREYVLAYVSGASAPASVLTQLASIKECAPAEVGGLCTVPTAFTWKANAGGYGSVSTHTVQPVGNRLSTWVDLNGDGRMDHVSVADGDVGHKVALSNGSGFTNQTWSVAQASTASDKIAFMDIDGDGDADFVKINPSSSFFAVSKSNGVDGYVNSSWVGRAPIGDDYRFVDLDSDGRTDFITWQNTDPDATIDYWTSFSLGTSYNNSSSPWQGPKLAGSPGLMPSSFQFHDVNGDKQVDLVLTEPSGGTGHYVYLRTGSGTVFTAPAGPVYANSAFTAGASSWADLNGDGLLDFVSVYAGAGGAADHYVSLWTGKTYVHQTWSSPYYGLQNYYRDMNGDGMADFVAINGQPGAGSGTHRISYSTGSGFVHQATVQGPVWTASNNKHDFPDIDGDGKPDFALYTSSLNFVINQAPAAHLIEKVTDGLGMETWFEYEPLTNSSVYTKLTNATWPTSDVVNAVHVVSRIKHPDGIGGHFETTYRYKGFKAAKSLLNGNLGFQEVTAEDIDRKVRTVTTYSQAGWMTGLPVAVDVTVLDKLDNGSNLPQVISETDIVYVQRSGPPPGGFENVHYVCVDSQSQVEYDVETGTALRTTLVDNDPGNSGVPCDAFGNPGQAGTADGFGTPLTRRTTVTDHVANPDVVHRTDTVTYFSNDTTNWLLSLPTRQAVKAFVDGVGDATKDRTTAVTFVPAKGVVQTVVREPEQSAPIKLTIDYEYDAFGNRKKETITPSETGGTPTPPQQRVERVDFDTAAGRFPAVLTNAEGHVTNLTFDPRFGAIATIDGPNATNGAFNDLITRTYDAFGRMKDERQPDGSYRVVYHKSVAVGASGSPGSNTKVMIETAVQNAAWGVTPTTRLTPVRTFFDGLGRELRTRSRAFDATNFVHADTNYDSRGRVYQASEPYYEGQTPTWNTPAYDVLNRTVGVTAADATQSTTTDYNAFTVTTTDAGNRQNRLIADALGRTIRTENFDTAGVVRATTEYLYDKAGNVTSIRRLMPNGTPIPNTAITNTYDRLGRRLSTIDPDFGIVGGTAQDGLITFQYDSMGDLRRQQTPRLAPSLYTELDYDRLGRLRTRRDPANDLIATVTSTFTFDEVPATPDDCRAGVGQLTTETIADGGEPGLTTTYCYSPAQFGRLAIEKRTTGGVTYQTNYTYDALGRLQQVKYPATTTWPSASRYAVNYSYTPRGHLERIQEAQGSATVLYQTTGANARGQIEKSYLGDGSRTTRNFVKNTDRLAFTNAAIGSLQPVQNFIYGYDGVGNISGRADLINSVSETFGYDTFDRLTASTVTNGTGPHPVSYAYDDAAGNLGNMTHKSDISTLASASMSYSTTARPHALTALNTGAGTRTFTYDSNGRMTAGQVASTTRALAYTSYDLLASATIGTTSRTFNYGADRQRYRQVSVSGGTTRTYTYIGEHYVKEVEGGATEHKLYIMANGEPVAYVSDDGSPETKYLHKDNLGSITTIITNQNFAGREKLSYDAWGKRRHGTDWWSAPAAASEERGYTGHEHLDNVNLIHMNGRAYDPQLARFTSPDPFVPDPLYSQSYNRYAYVYNNPLRYTDPSGFQPWGPCVEDRCPGDDGIEWTCSWICPYDLYVTADPWNLAMAMQEEAPPAPTSLPVADQSGKTDQEGLKPQPTLGSALKDVGSGILLGAAGFVPYLGDALDVYDVVRPGATTGDRAIAGGSLALNAWTLGLAPNAGPIVKGGRRVGSGAADLWAVSKGWRDEAATAAKSAWERAKRWASGCGCFVAGTLVATSMGLTPIEDIEVGDQVWARNEATGQIELKPVTALIRPPQRVIWKVTFEMDEGTGVAYAEFEVTDDHPWAAIDGTWVRTDELKPGIEILRAHGVPARVMSVVQTERAEQTYNLEVADFHTYFVGDAWVWVHNAKACNPGANDGIIYLRRDANGGEYVGQSSNPGAYARRQRRHASDHPTESFTFEELERVPPGSGRSLDVAEEDWIRAGGGPQSTGGQLQNDRHQMNEDDYRAAGGTINYP